MANIAVGYDNIDLAAARARGVVVTNTPDVLTEATADFTWGLILAVTRRIAEGERLLRRGEWKGWALDFMLGSELRGKQLGIVGMGRIGRAVAARAGASACGSRARRSSPAPDAQGAADAAWTRLGLDELLSTLRRRVAARAAHAGHAAPRSTAARILRMKRGAYLVNTSRGPVVDEAALAWALARGADCRRRARRVRARAARAPDLLGLENVVLAPHLGSATVETRTAMADLAARNVLAVLVGLGRPSHRSPA